MNRRQFINRTALAALMPTFARFPRTDGLVSLFDESDEVICKSKFDLAVSKNLVDKPINEVIVEIGRSFIGTEYGAHVLEEPGEEHLVINMRALDCVSFYENALVLARCVKMKKFSFEDYTAQMQFIRYRGGVIAGYPSRLHYTTDYMYDNELKGVWKVVTKEIFGEKNVQPLPKPVNFMSTHRDIYKQLANDAFYEAIKRQEGEINTRNIFFLPKGNLHLFADAIQSGDILGITTNIPGLDTSHTGIAVRTDDGVLRLMHAPNVGHKVQITDTSLHDYLARNSKQTGVTVARALEPT